MSGGAFSPHMNQYGTFSAPNSARFDQKAPEDIEFEAVNVYGNSVELSADRIEDRLFR
jgi:hypothetical protein